jgi:hypothetical protein
MSALAAVLVTYSYWVQPCDPAAQSGCLKQDAELAEWALQAWERSAQGQLRFVRQAEEQKAQLRIYWAPRALQLYGEARPILVEGKRGAAIYVRPEISGERGRQDALFRDAVVYLTCLHESGHALGLDHTRRFDDIMYSFGYGGDIAEYFERYRRKLRRRDDIQKHSGMSDADAEALRKALGGN